MVTTFYRCSSSNGYMLSATTAGVASWVAPAAGTITGVRFDGHGCAISQAAASMASDEVVGMNKVSTPEMERFICAICNSDSKSETARRPRISTLASGPGAITACTTAKVVERAVLLGKEPQIMVADLPSEIRGAMNVVVSNPSGKQTLKEALAYGTVVASYNVEDFSLDRLKRIARSDLEGRMEEYRRMLSF